MTDIRFQKGMEVIGRIRPIAIWTSASIVLLLVATTTSIAYQGSVIRVQSQEGYVPEPERVVRGSGRETTAEQMKLIQQNIKEEPENDPAVPQVGTPVGPPRGTETIAAGGPKMAALTTTPSPGKLLVFPENVSSYISGSVNYFEEPTIAVAGANRFATGNTWALYQNGGPGSSWQFISPFTEFPSLDQGFWSDQETVYDPSRDMLLWELLYYPTATDGHFRVAVRKNTSSGISPSGWYYYTFSPTNVGGPGNEYFDVPRIVLGTNYLYITPHVYSTTTHKYIRSVVIRLPLDQLASNSALSFNYFSSNNWVGFTGAKGTKDVFWFASHNSTSSVELFGWPENSATINQYAITVPTWSNGQVTCPVGDGTDWCRTNNEIISGARVNLATTGENELWFFWMVGPGSGFPYTYVEAARIAEQNHTYVGRPLLWSSVAPIAYPGAAPNLRGDIGLGFFEGNGTLGAPSFYVGLADDYSGVPAPWETYLIASSIYGPPYNRWGDFVAPSVEYPSQFWDVPGWTIQATQGPNILLTQFVRFGRTRDWSGEQRWTTK